MRSIPWKKIWIPLALLSSSLSLVWGANSDPHAALKAQFLQAAYDQDESKLTTCIEKARNLDIVPELVAAIGEVKLSRSDVNSTPGNALHQLFVGTFHKESIVDKRYDVLDMYRLQCKCLAILLDAGCPCNATNSFGVTPLYIACDLPDDFIQTHISTMEKQGLPTAKIQSHCKEISELQVTMIRVLLLHGADPALLGPEDGESAFDGIAERYILGSPAIQDAFATYRARIAAAKEVWKQKQ